MQLGVREQHRREQVSRHKELRRVIVCDPLGLRVIRARAADLICPADEQTAAVPLSSCASEKRRRRCEHRLLTVMIA
jgi:hypothetical protein